MRALPFALVSTVFMATAARDVTGKMLACYAPIMAFVAMGFDQLINAMQTGVVEGEGRSLRSVRKT